MKKLAVYWSRRDFRLHDNPALNGATSSDSPVLPIFILEDYMLEANPKFQFGYPSRLFLTKALVEYSKNFNIYTVVKGKGAQTFINLSKHFELEIHVNEDVYIDFYKQVEKLRKHNLKVIVYKDMLSVDKDLRTGTGNLYSIFTPFKKATWSSFIQEKVLAKINPKNIQYISKNDLEHIPHKIEISEENIWKQFSHERKIQLGRHELDLNDLLGKPDKCDFPYVSEEECLKHFKKYLHNNLKDYKDDRNSLEKDITSKMSLGLSWGLVSARTLKQEIVEYFDKDFLDINWFKLNEKDLGPISYLSELIWREFYKYLFFHNPNLMHEEFQEKFKYKVNWVDDKLALQRFIAWIKGETGYKIVDAAMMQLKQTHWMHNRARMIVASVLTKNLGVDWRWGQEYFRAMLSDLDEASNNGGWQWGASVGADPKPIRIFNPYLQAENYDSNGKYQKKWLGEEKYFFNTEPIVPHKEARNDALKRYGLANKEVRDY